MKLYILGNGFDLAHKLPTHYGDFRNYLEENEPEFLIEFEKLYNCYPIIDEKCTPSIIERRRDRIKEYLWKNFEENLSKFDMQTIFDVSESMCDLMSNDVGDVGVKDTMDVYWNDNYKFLYKVDELMLQWVKSISLSKIPKRCKFDADDLFLTFNYTQVLEEIYRIPENQVLHIHGSIHDGEIIVGHGDNVIIEKLSSNVLQSQERFDEFGESVYEFIYKIQSKYLKDSKKIIFVNRSFFDNLKYVNEVYVMGHSFGKVDWAYFEEVNKNIKGAVWNVYYHESNDKEAFDCLNKKIKLQKSKLNLEKSDKFWTR